MADAGHVAEHLAIDLLGRMVDHQAGGAGAGAAGAAIPAGCESACRWLGATGRWSILAIVADQSASPDPSKPETLSRGVAIDRLLAESLMQTRRGRDAMLWWTAIIDAWQCDDFPTLIRGAETAVAYGDIDSAQSRLEAAQTAAGDDAFRSSLVRMLEAEMAIRRARMDEARDLLAGIVRAGDTVAELRPRAQWMIGETYFLQQKYNEAIDAYRRVDALDAEGEWAAAALLQAGKSFEKLSRSREAATCYTALLSRFANLPHANQARTRLAQLGGDPSLRR
jgi:tetratricopeptide (TPR) repeat protein